MCYRYAVTHLHVEKVAAVPALKVAGGGGTPRGVAEDKGLQADNSPQPPGNPHFLKLCLLHTRRTKTRNSSAIVSTIDMLGELAVST